MGLRGIRAGASLIAMCTAWLTSAALDDNGKPTWTISTDAMAGCIWGCKDRLHQCNDGCRLNVPNIKSCGDLVSAVEPRVRHHIHHHCKKVRGHKQVIDCSWDHLRRDDYGAALEAGLLRRKCRGGLNDFKNRIYHHPQVKKKIKEHIGYWRPGNFWAKLETVKDDAVSDIGKALEELGSFTFDRSCRAPLEIATKVKPILDKCRKSRGRTVATKCSFDRPRENCNPGEPAIPVPRALLQGNNEGRLKDALRKAAKRVNPTANLCTAAKHFAQRKDALGYAYADLVVTGRSAYKAFRRARPSFRTMAKCRAPKRAISKALDRAYRVAFILRTGNKAERRRLRPRYVAVSGEDDTPHRPVNVGWSDSPQYDLQVPVRLRHNRGSISVNTRFTIAEKKARKAAAPRFRSGRLPPTPKPTLRPDANIILYVHGMDSRAEEADRVAKALHKDGRANWTMISVDLPSSGYADKVDYRRLIRGGGINSLGRGVGFEHGTFDNIRGPKFAVLDFIEDFIVSFVNTLDRKIKGGVKNKIVAVIGGSLGGNMALRLGRRPEPWIRSVVSWSPGSIWNSYAKGNDTFKDKTLKTLWQDIGGERTNLTESFGQRKTFFKKAFGRPVAVMPPQPEMWWRSDWACKSKAIKHARAERQEIYSRNFRLWHWRLAMEQLVFSHQGIAPSFRSLAASNRKPMILACGTKDEFCYTNICSATIKTAMSMKRTPGELVVLNGIGHSFHDEVPNYWARKILGFVRPRPSPRVVRPSRQIMMKTKPKTKPMKVPTPVRPLRVKPSPKP